MLEIAINSNNECGKSIDEILKNIKTSGFNNVMIASKVGNLEESIQKAINLQLQIPYIHLNTHYANDMWVQGQANSDYVNSVIKDIEICGKYNIPIAVIHATNGDPASEVIKPNKHALNCMQKILECAKQNNVQIALENVDKLSFKHFKYLMKNFKELGFCYDLGHHQLYNPKFNLVKKYGNRLIAVHIHDNLMDWRYGKDFTRDLHLIPFDGKINYNQIIGNLAKTSYNNVVMLEVHKISCSNPQIYEKLTNRTYLNKCYKVANKLKNMLEEKRSEKI